jgi:hypothetical protein
LEFGAENKLEVAVAMCIRWLFGLSLVVIATVSGCNKSGLDLAYVEGVVTYNGQPVDSAGVIFKPVTGPFAMGTTDAEGKFTLVTANYPGALVGEHKVGISKSKTTPIQMKNEALPRYKVEYFVPQKYTSPATSDLKATVSSKKSENHFTFDLKGKIESGS